MLKTILGFFLLSSVGFGQDVSPEGLWSKGLGHYDRGEYQEAVQVFEELLVADSKRGYVLYNLGNAYYKLGKNGDSLGAYLAAKRYLPRDPNLKANIDFVYKFTEDRLGLESARPAWTKGFFWIDRLNLPEQLYLGSTVMGFAFLVFACGFWLKNQNLKVFGWFSGVCFTVALLVFSGALVTTNFQEHWGAVSVPVTDVYSGKNTGTPVVFKLKEGAPVIVEREDSNWVNIRLSDGKKGWIPKATVKYYL